MCPRSFVPCSFFVLTPTDLEDWDADGETWFHEQGSSHWKDKLRPCAEALLLQLFEQHKDVSLGGVFLLKS